MEYCESIFHKKQIEEVYNHCSKNITKSRSHIWEGSFADFVNVT